MPEDTIGTCSLDGCPVGEGGACQQGHETLGECPHFQPTELTALEEEESERRIPIHSAAELSETDTAPIMRSTLARILVMAGPADSGKTTILTSLYELFQAGPFAELQFGGSRSLHAFERRCHMSRIASERDAPETERTKLSYDIEYLHLRLRPMAEGSRALVFLMTDLPGERFRLARDSEEECKKLSVLKRADHVAVLLDGQKLADLRTRTQAFQDTRALIRSFVDAEMIDHRTMLQIVFSKWDLVENATEIDDVKKFVDSSEKKLTNEFGDRVGDVSAFRIAARPETTVLPFGFGLDGLLSHWASHSLILAGPRPSGRVTRQARSEFERFLSRPVA